MRARYPSKLGQPCWSAGQVAKVLPSAATAQTSSGSAPYFLAAHSPFRGISDYNAPSRLLAEEDVFRDVFSEARAQVQALIKGEPGTGKSHLVRWLKLRADYAAEHRQYGLDKFKLVLVSRGNGSLKDSLNQIVTQLGGDFHEHLLLIQGAIDKLSDANARATLLSELALEIGTRWTERDRTALPNSLRHFSQALMSPGFGRWMKRDGGTIHRLIQRLTEQSTSEEREVPVAFAAEDFLVAPGYLRRDETSNEVVGFCDDLREEEGLPDLAAQTLNVALTDAIQMLTGLRGADLLNIFTEIRRVLRRQGKSLGVFIEDVSVAIGGLDQEVINAFEPRVGDGLCRMIAVLGIVDAGWTRLPRNQKDRATHVFEVGGDVAAQWSGDPLEVARFTARYLNAVRSDDAEIDRIAEDRFASDVSQSKCNSCPHRQPCIDAFGGVELMPGSIVGMFPFTQLAPHSLLNRVPEAYKSQRTLIKRVLLPTLDQSHDLFALSEFPKPAIYSAQVTRPLWWAGFENRFCGGSEWTQERKLQISFLAQFWTSATTAEDLAAEIEPLRGPLGLPKFSSAAVARPKDKAEEKPKPKSFSHAQEDPELDRLLGILNSWHSGQPLQQDNRFRDLAYGFVAKSIVWEDRRGTPIAEVQRLVSSNKFPRIEGQVAQPAAQTYFVDLPRGDDTYHVLEALLLFERRGRRSWNFEHAEVHKRALSRWLRKHQNWVVSTLVPASPSMATVAVRIAVQVLALAAFLRDRKQLHAGRAEQVDRVLSPLWPSERPPAVLSRELRSVVSDLEQRHRSLVEFLVRELGAGQGRALPRDFIDPLPILNALTEFERELGIAPPPTELDQGFWKPRFTATAKLSGYSKLPQYLDAETKALSGALEEVRAFVVAAGFDAKDLKQGLVQCLEALTELVVLQRGSQRQKPLLAVPNDEFDGLWQERVLQDAKRRESWSNVVAEAEVTATSDRLKVLAFDPIRLRELVIALDILRRHLDLIESHIADEERAGGAATDSRQQLLSELTGVAKAAGVDEKADPES